MEAVGATAYLLAGSDILILRHPETVKLVKRFMAQMINGDLDLGPSELKAKLAALNVKPKEDFTEIIQKKAADVQHSPVPAKVSADIEEKIKSASEAKAKIEVKVKNEEEAKQSIRTLEKEKRETEGKAVCAEGKKEMKVAEVQLSPVDKLLAQIDRVNRRK